MCEKNSSLVLPENPTDGFTLIETLISFAILTSVLIATLVLLASASKQQTRARETYVIVEKARSKLDELLATKPRTNTTQSGQFSQNLVWQLEIRPLNPPASKAQLTVPSLAHFFVRKNSRNETVFELKTIIMAKHHDKN